MVEKSLLRPSCNIFALQQMQPLESLWRKFKTGKIESRRDRAATERPGPEAPRALPMRRWHDGLRALAGAKVVAEAQARRELARWRNGELERRARMPKPNFHRIDAVPPRHLPAARRK